jgi:hypothetical protein
MFTVLMIGTFFFTALRAAYVTSFVEMSEPMQVGYICRAILFPVLLVYLLRVGVCYIVEGEEKWPTPPDDKSPPSN